jgi:hypothetical protein
MKTTLPPEPHLVRYDAMCQAIAAAYQVDEVKTIRDRAVALEHYSRLANNVEAERQCCEIRLRAERRAGQLLKQLDKGKGRLKRGRNFPTSPEAISGKPIADLGITYNQSSQWQRLADVPEAEFEAALAGSDKPTTKGLVNGAKPKEPRPVSDEALWVWGRLREFERRGILKMGEEDAWWLNRPQTAA